MKIAVTSFELFNELDIVLAHKRASQLCDLTGIGFYAKTSFITAISEICRNSIEHAGGGKIVFDVYTDGSQIEAVISDHGPGIENLDSILNRYCNPGTKGCGLQNSKKLADFFAVDSSERGTIVTLGMKINTKSFPVNKGIIEEWERFFETEKPVSPYEEIKRQNEQLLEITDQLRIKNLETDEQLVQIKDLNNQLHKYNQELEDFASTLSHDLRSPIANLKMLIAIIENASTEEKKASYIKELKSQVDRLDTMVMGLAEIIDLKNNKNNIANSINFEDILNVVNVELKKETEATNCQIQWDFHKRPVIKYYEVYLHSILINLVSNALKYHSPENDPKINITSGTEDDKVILIVQDNGIGMDLKKIGKNLFKPFTRFTNIADGRGLGLHLIKGMVEKNGGRIEVKSEPGKGATFKIYMKEYK